MKKESLSPESKACKFTSIFPIFPRQRLQQTLPAALQQCLISVLSLKIFDVLRMIAMLEIAYIIPWGPFLRPGWQVLRYAVFVRR